MKACSGLFALLFAVFVGAASAGAAVDVLSVASDVWLRSGPSTSHPRLTGLSRGTALVEIADVKTAFQSRGERWIQVHVLDGRAAGRQGWVWGGYVRCCEEHDWLQR